jgi:predicted transposase YdaD
MSGLHQPHDKIVKATFSDIPTACAFLQAELPTSLVPHIDWSTLRLESGSHIDAEFSASSSDLLYTARLGGDPAYIYILFEHQSTEDPWIALRLLSYMVGIWRDHARKAPAGTRLPPILPLVLAQDNKPWKTSTRFADLVQAPEALAEAIQKHTPDFEFQLVELFRMPFEKILGTPMGILTLRALKAEKISALLDDAVWDEMLMVQLQPEEFERFLRYIFDRGIDKPDFRRKLKTITDPKLIENAMSLAEQLREEGRQEVRSLAEQFRKEGRQAGRQEGHQEGRQAGHQEGLIASKQQDIVEALEIRFGTVPEGLREEIELIGDPVKLTNLHRAAILCADIESFAREL